MSQHCPHKRPVVLGPRDISEVPMYPFPAQVQNNSPNSDQHTDNECQKRYSLENKPYPQIMFETPVKGHQKPNDAVETKPSHSLEKVYIGKERTLHQNEF